MDLTHLQASSVLRTLSVAEPYGATELPFLNSRWLPASGASEFHCAGFSLDGAYLILAAKDAGITDGALIGMEAVVGLEMEDKDRVRINGRDFSASMIGLGRAMSEFKIANQVRRTSAYAVFPSDMRDRGWPETGPLLSMAHVAPGTMRAVRKLLAELFGVASSAPECFAWPHAVAGMSESLLAAFDEAFLSSTPADAADLSVPQFRIARRIQDFISANVNRPIYRDEIASACGVAPRTVYNVVLRYHGMNLHRYVRLHRLWSARCALLACDPDVLVKSIALDHGFWHLGRFSRDYQTQFGELPSETLGRRR